MALLVCTRGALLCRLISVVDVVGPMIQYQPIPLKKYLRGIWIFSEIDQNERKCICKKKTSDFISLHSRGAFRIAYDIQIVGAYGPGRQ